MNKFSISGLLKVGGKIHSKACFMHQKQVEFKRLFQRALVAFKGLYSRAEANGNTVCFMSVQLITQQQKIFSYEKKNKAQRGAMDV